MILVFGMILQPAINLQPCGDKTVFWNKQHHQSLSQGAQYQELEALSVKIQAHLIQAVDLAFGGIRIPLYYGMPMHWHFNCVFLVLHYFTLNLPHPPILSSRSNAWNVMNWMETDCIQLSPPCPAFVLQFHSWPLFLSPYSQISQSL